MKKGSGSRLCCLEWVALRSHSKPSSFPVLLVRFEGHGCSPATVTAQFFSTDFNLFAFLSIHFMKGLHPQPDRYQMIEFKSPIRIRLQALCLVKRAV